VSHRVYLTLGSNVEPADNLPAGLALLRPHGLAAVSGVYETAPIGTGDGRPFLNAAVLLVTDTSPEEFKVAVCRRIEAQLGRIRRPDDKFAPRTIDLDIALWDDIVRKVLGSPVPDPDIVRHLHVARPLADLAPDLVHPTDGRTLGAIAAALSARAPREALPRLRTGLIGWELSY
jgi:2-amino-4-hydroxy-6-hydroxymethyldihydropteridine diphosphokinase